MTYGRRHSHPDGRAAVAVRGDGHRHHLDRGKLSHDAHDVNYTETMNDAYNNLARHAWPVFKHDQPPLSSVSTSREPLISTSSTTANNTQPPTSFTDRYSRCLEIIHYGTNSTVRLHERKATPGFQSRQLLAIKVYRHSIVSSDSTSNSNNSTRIITSPSSLNDAHPHHPNILPILDLLQNERGELCLVMPYCAGGDLRTLLSRNSPLPTTETDCIIAQILRALAFLHKHDVAHRDLRLETVLLTTRGAVKLAGFGDGHIRRLWAECSVPAAEPKDHHPHPSPPASWSFSLPWLFSPFYRATPSSSSHSNFSSKIPAWISNTSTASIPGLSLPYIPPEAFNHRHHKPHHPPFHRKSSTPSTSEDDDEQPSPPDPRPADIWATAMIYMTLVKGRLLWHSARPGSEDGRYLEYIRCRSDEDGYSPIEALGKVCFERKMG
ncbi:hypothetical protein N7510_006105 [Penicillium lagena]|uniref:uncharacterized protein n=1 Tax=Penicillium lagena TaxID=94218 RepID=UPI00253F9241|nr:uncharacterized protein N7510_006105 [Penicillium lagena]KAJ5612911.1 hypothetical protein N7510_006105 [Penicillium lagena]